MLFPSHLWYGFHIFDPDFTCDIVYWIFDVPDVTWSHPDVYVSSSVVLQVGVLRWSLSTTDESQMPLTINCWPEAEGGGQMNVSMEYELVRVCVYDYVCCTVSEANSSKVQSRNISHSGGGGRGVTVESKIQNRNECRHVRCFFETSVQS